MQMKFRILVGLICIAVMSVQIAEAKSSRSQVLSDNDYQNLILKTKNLNLKKSSDRLQGEAIALKLVDQLLLPLRQHNKEDFESEWKNRFELARESSIFDSESQIAQVLSEQIIKIDSTRTKYEKFILEIPSSKNQVLSCKHKYLEAVVSEQICFSKNKISSKDMIDKNEIDHIKSCVSEFQYELCLQKMPKH